MLFVYDFDCFMFDYNNSRKMHLKWITIWDVYIFFWLPGFFNSLSQEIIF